VSSFQIHDFSNEVRCIYHVVMSRVLQILSLTLITMDRARCLYALLTEAAIDYGSIIMVTMMSIRHVDSCTTLPYGALVTWIIQHARVVTDGMVELAHEKKPITNSTLTLAMDGKDKRQQQELRARIASLELASQPLVPASLSYSGSLSLQGSLGHQDSLLH
jgi:hypothetical protein